MISNAAPYTVPREPGPWKAVALAVFVHALLLAFLVIGINWANNTPETLDTEVWSPQELEQAPPPVVTPPPQPTPQPTPEVEKTPTVDPEIALEAEKKRKKQEKEKADKEAAAQHAEDLAKQQEQEKLDAKKLADEKHQQEAKDAKILEQARKADRARIAGDVNSTSNGTAAQSMGNKGDPAWSSRVAAKIHSNITGFSVPRDAINDPAEFVVGLLPDGSVASIRQTKKSAYPLFDEAVKRAINDSQPYPRDTVMGRVPPSFSSTHYPKDSQ